MEGARLDSQITIQRNISGYKTARSSEFAQILARRRNKVEEEKDSAREAEKDSAREAEKISARKAEKDSARDQKITENFSFLQDYDNKPGYQTDEESEEDFRAAAGNPGTNTLKEQIKKQRKKIINQSFDGKPSR